jgi:tetratricopeptide (TPR) repeat protein
MAASAEAPRKTIRRLNRRALVTIIVTVFVAIPALIFFAAWSRTRTKPTLMAQARKAFDAGNYPQASNYIESYLEINPDDLDALELKCELLSDKFGKGEDAIPIGDRILQLDPDRDKTRRRMAKLKLASKSYLVAESHVRQLLRHGVDDAEVHRLLAFALEQQAKPGEISMWNDVAAEYATALARDPKDIDSATRLATIEATRLDHPDKALEVLDAILAARPDDYQVRLARRRYFIERGDGEKARTELLEALRIAPDNAEVLIQAASEAIDRGELPLARRYIESLPQKGATGSLVSLQKGLIEMKEGDINGAVASWRGGLVDSGGNDAGLALRLSQILLMLGKIDQADPMIAQYRRLIGAESTGADIKYLLALREFALNKPAGAIAILREIEAKAPGKLRGDILLLMGRSHAAMGNRVAAIDSFRGVVGVDPKRIDGWILLAQQLEAANQLDDAERALSQAIAQNPRSPRLTLDLNRLKWRRAQIRGGDRARTEIQKAIAASVELAPGDPDLIAMQANSLILDGKRDQGIKLFENAIKLNPKSAELRAALARALGDAGRIDEALAALDRARAELGDKLLFRINRARIHNSDNQTRLAIADLTRFGDRSVENPADLEYLEKHPDEYLTINEQPDLWRSIADLYTAINDSAKVQSALRNWARIAPDDSTPRVRLFNTALVAGNSAEIDKALADLKPEGDQNPRPWIDANIRRLLRDDRSDPSKRAERVDEAETWVKKFEALDPGGLEATLFRALITTLRADLVNKTDPGRGEALTDQAIELYQKAVEQGGGRFALQPLITLLSIRKRVADIDKIRERASEFDFEIDPLLSVAYLQLDDKAKAEQLAGQFLNAKPGDLDSRVFLARMQNSLGKPEKAIETLQSAARANPKDPQTWFALLLFQTGLGKIDDARRTVETMRTRVVADKPELLFARAYRLVGDRERAEEFFDQAMKKWPDDGAIRSAYAQFLEDSDRVPRAIDVLKPLLEKKPPVEWAARLVALLMAKRVDNENSWLEAEKIVGHDDKPDDTIDDRFVRAQVYSYGRTPERVEHARALFQKLLTDEPLIDKLRLSYYDFEIRQNRLDLAYPQIERLAKNDDPEYLAPLVSVATSMKKFDEAHAALNRLVAKQPLAPRTIERQARLLAAENKNQEAAETLKRGFDQLKSTPNALVAANLFIRTLVDLEAFEIADRIAAEVAPKNPEIELELAAALGDRHRTDDALKLCSLAFDRGLKTRAAIVAVGIVAADPNPDEKRFKLVADLASKARDADPSNLDLLMRYAMSEHFLKRYKNEVQIYQDILKISPRNIGALNNMAWTISENLGDPAEGLKIVDQAIEYYDRHQYLLDTRGVILISLKRYDAAIADLKDSIRATPRGIVYFHLARAYVEAGKKAEAEAAFKQAQNLGFASKLQPEERPQLQALKSVLTAQK